jgi:putative transposase
MAYRKISLAPGEYFHIYNRGNSKQDIFLSDADKDRFVKLLFVSNSSSKKGYNFRDHIVEKKIDAWDFERGDPLVSIGAWALMPNHFHLYITCPPTEKEEDAKKSNIALFLHKLCVGYVKYFNQKYGRTGSLFEGRFKSVHVKNDNHAKYLFSYIHLNPVKLIDSDWMENGINNPKLALEYLNSYKWSSYNDHRGVKRKESKILQLEHFPKYFSDLKNFDSEILSWLEYK